MKKINELIKKEAAEIQKRIDEKYPSAKAIWNATPEEVMERATQSVLREYDLTGLDGNQLTLLGSNRQPMYLAKITGTDDKYGLKREFLDNPSKGKSSYTFTLEPNTLYAWKENRVEYYGYFDGQEMHVMTKEEMMDAAENGVKLEEVKEENVEVEETQEVKEIEKVEIDFAKIAELLETTTQKEIADRTGISQAAISKYKRGETALIKMSVENAMKLMEESTVKIKKYELRVATAEVNKNEICEGCTQEQNDIVSEVIKEFCDLEAAKAALENYQSKVEYIGRNKYYVTEYYVEINEYEVIDGEEYIESIGEIIFAKGDYNV